MLGILYSVIYAVYMSFRVVTDKHLRVLDFKRDIQYPSVNSKLVQKGDQPINIYNYDITHLKLVLHLEIIKYVNCYLFRLIPAN